MNEVHLILGGAGLVGLQVCRTLARELKPSRLIVASLLEHEAREAVTKLQDEFGSSVEFLPAWGNLFVPADLAYRPRAEVLADAALRRRLLDGLYGEFEAAYHENHLVQLVLTHRPAVVVDCVNTATGLSYQNVFDGVNKVRNWLGEEAYDPAGIQDLEHFLLSQSVPQIIRHVRFLHRATTEAGTRVYVKAGTTGTGGMGLNIPYTHSEDKPSKVLLAKTEAAFGHTGLLFCMARTPGGPVVKEVKPAAMIGYRAIKTLRVADRHGNDKIFEPQALDLSSSPALPLKLAADAFEVQGDLVVSVVDTGENGVFTRGEFGAITALGQMQFVTPEEIAHTICLEIRGANTGRDIVGALDSAVLEPSYKAGMLRSMALQYLAGVEAEAELPSVALGRLGPPELSKLLFEAQLLRECFGSIENTLAEGERARTPEELAERMSAQLSRSAVRTLAPSIGIPILTADGQTLLRGPRINVPEIQGYTTEVPLSAENLGRWARRGWIDLRPENLALWLDRFARMTAARREPREVGSAAADTTAWLGNGFEIGEVVAWIFNNEMDGTRLK